MAELDRPSSGRRRPAARKARDRSALAWLRDGGAGGGNPSFVRAAALLALYAWAGVAAAQTLYAFNWGTAAATWQLAGWSATTWPASNGGSGTGSCNVANNTKASSLITYTNVNGSGVNVTVTVTITNGCFVRSTGGVQNNSGPAGPELRFDANGGTSAGCTGGTTSCPDLGLFVDFTANTPHTVIVNYAFSAPVSIQGLPVRDIDYTSGQYQDVITVQALDHASNATINPDGISPFTTTPNYTVGTNSVTGINTNVAVTDPNGWVSFNFAKHLVDSMTLTYGDPASLLNPGQQQVLLGGFAFSTVALSTRVVIAGVRAYADGGGSWVEWETASEIGTTGFNVYRLDPATEEFVRVNDRLLPALGAERQGGVYRLADPLATPGRTATYGFEEIEAGGGRHVYGPFTVTAGVGRPWPKRAVDAAAAGTGYRSPGTNGFERLAHRLDARANESSSEQRSKSVSVLASAPPSALPTRSSRADTAIRIEVEHEGVYVLTADQIAKFLGATPAQVQGWIGTGQLRLRQRGQPVPWRADPSSSRLYFYGQAIDGIDSVYTRANVYWLDHAAGPTMRVVNAAPPPSARSAVPFTSHVHVAVNAKPLYWLVTDPDADFWYWDYVETDAGPTSFALPVPDLAGAGGLATLTVYMLGASDDDRSAHLVLNPSAQNCDLGSTPFWRGIAPRVYTTAPFSASCLNPGDNVVAVSGAVPAQGADSFFWVKGFDVDYPRGYHAVDDRLRFGGVGNPAISVDRFTSTDIAILDVTDPRSPQWVAGAAVTAADNGGAVSFAPVADRTYVAAVARAPLATVGATPTTWKSAKNGASHLALAPRALRADADAYATYRGATVVELQDIYDEFNYGIANPHAIRDFLAYANGNWKPAPRFVALLGKGTIDPKNYMGYGGNLFPLLMVPTPNGLFNSDNRYADFNDDGVPDLAIGRIPARAPGDVANYVAKLSAHESATRAPIAQALLVADNPDPEAGDFSADSMAVAQALKARKVATTSLDRNALPSGSAVRAQIVAALNSSTGVGLFNYVGHGAYYLLGSDAGDPLFSSDDVGLLANGKRLPIFAAFTCEVGDGTYPGTDSLTEALLWRQGGGAIAAFAPTALSGDPQAHVLNLSLIDALANPQSGATLGEAAAAALREFAGKGGSRYILDIYQVFGDPALRLRP